MRWSIFLFLLALAAAPLFSWARLDCWVRIKVTREGQKVEVRYRRADLDKCIEKKGREIREEMKTAPKKGREL